MTLSEVKQGDVLMLFDADGHSFGGATSHTLTVSPEYTEISCKDAGQFPWKKLSKVNWEISTENLYVESDYVKLLSYTMADTEFDVIFGESNWNADGLQKNSYTYWSNDTTASMLYKGKVKVSNLTLNAASGENANYSATLQGNGPFSPVSNG